VISVAILAEADCGHVIGVWQPVTDGLARKDVSHLGNIVFGSSEDDFAVRSERDDLHSILVLQRLSERIASGSLPEPGGIFDAGGGYEFPIRTEDNLRQLLSMLQGRTIRLTACSANRRKLREVEVFVLKRQDAKSSCPGNPGNANPKLGCIGEPHRHTDRQSPVCYRLPLSSRNSHDCD
jgi:hypothetical protein